MKSSPSLLSAHIRLLIQSAQPNDAKVLRTARKYTSRTPKSAQVWLARLAAERQLGFDSEGWDTVERVWAEARGLVAEGSEEELGRIWLWGLEVTRFHKDSGEARGNFHEVRNFAGLDPWEEILIDFGIYMHLLGLFYSFCA